MSKLKTALITGSSEGIGRSFAQIYAKNGHDLVLVARNVAKLTDFATELKTKYAVEVHVFPADLIPVDAPQIRVGHKIGRASCPTLILR